MNEEKLNQKRPEPELSNIEFSARLLSLPISMLTPSQNLKIKL